MSPRIPKTVDAGLLGLYLSDHLTGATGGVNRIQRMAAGFAGTPVAADLARLAEQITAERGELQDLIHQLKLPQRAHRQALAWLAERAGRVKLNGRLFSQSPMTMVLETELMRGAVAAKLGGWQTLHELAGDLGLDATRFAQLIERAHAQLQTLDRVHEFARSNAFRKAEQGNIPQ